MKHISALTGILLLSLTTAIPQHLLLEKEVPDGLPQVNGPGSRYFSHFYMGTGFVAAQSHIAEIPVRYFFSRYTAAGWRNKFKAGRHFAFGLETEYIKTVYDIKQEEGKVFPNEILHKQEMLVLNQAGPGVFLRIQPGKRGDYMGNFLDLGGKACILLQGKLVVKDHEVPDEYRAQRSRTVYKRLQYLEPLSYGFFVRAGINRVALVADCRLSGLFKKEFDEFPEMPQWSFGLQLGFH